MNLDSLTRGPLAQIEALMLAEMKSEVPLAELVMHYTIDNGGKRFRPLLTILSGGLCGTPAEATVLAGAFIEFIHSATLLHDDVVDESPLRRGQPAAQVAFGNAASVLVGDFLYTRAFQLMVRSGHFGVIETMADAVNLIAAGEVMQLSNRHDPDVDEGRYFRVIELKTAVLFSVACKVAAQLAGQPPAGCEALYQYGRKLGLAFQIIDDLLDYTGAEAAIGKALGDDLAEGKPTLALIRAQQQLPEPERQRLRQIIEHGDRSAFGEVLELLRRTDALEHSRATAERLIDEAIAELERFPAGAYKEALAFIARRAVQRDR